MRKLKPVTIGKYRLGNLRTKRGGALEAVVTFDDEGKRRRFRLGEALTQDQAEAALHAFVRQREILTARSDSTVEALFQGYVKDKELDGKPTTNQRMHWRTLKKTFGAMSPSDIDKEMCRAYHRRRVAAGCSIGTVWTELTALRAILKWAEKDGQIVKAPHILVPKKPEPKDKRLTMDMAQRLLDACALEHLKLFVNLALQTGARMGALLGLTWDRVDFDRGIIDLRDPGLSQDIKRRAVVPMNGTARAALLRAMDMALSKHVIEWNGERISSVKKALKNAAKAAGMPWASAHTLRHTAACRMAENGVPMSEISQFLGHTSTRITERVYARYSPDYLQKAAAALEMPTVRSASG
jgi:integrase